MYLNILSINPNFFISPFKNGLIYKAIKLNKIILNVFNINNFIKNSRFDGKIYGGGAGLILRPEPLYLAIKKVNSIYSNSFVIYLSPQGKIIDKFLINKLLSYKSLIFICGRYNGIDQRIIDKYVNIELSIGDYIISCGEISTLVVIDILVRNIPGILNNIESSKLDSFNYLNGLLGYP